MARAIQNSAHRTLFSCSFSRIQKLGVEIVYLMFMNIPSKAAIRQELMPGEIDHRCPSDRDDYEDVYLLTHCTVEILARILLLTYIHRRGEHLKKPEP